MAPGGDDRPSDLWPVEGVRAVLDNLDDAVVVCDTSGIVRHANPAAERLLGWPPGDLTARRATDVLAPDASRRLVSGFEAFVEATARRSAGKPVRVRLRRPDGTEVVVEVVLSVVDRPRAGRALVAVIRPRAGSPMARWQRLASELVEILTATAANEAPADRLLSTLGTRLHWDVATLWTSSSSGALSCQHVWRRGPDVAGAFVAEKAADPSSGSESIPRWVFDHQESLWVSDLGADPRFASEAVRRDGLTSAYAFPIRYRGSGVGVVKLLSRRRRDPDPELDEIMGAVSDQLGEILNAATLAAERKQLVAELEGVRRHQEFLLLASRALAEASDYQKMVERLAQVSVPALADLCLVDLRNEDGELERMAAWHADPSKQALADELRAHYAPDPSGSHPSVDVLRSGRSRWDPHMSDEFLRAISRDDRHFAILKELGFTSYMTVPLKVAAGVLGTITLVSAGSGRRFTSGDLALAEELAAQVASVMARARALDHEEQISHQLQQSLLPASIPEMAGWSVAVRYVPAALGAHVGSDWFDVLQFDDGRAALMIGDVEGHDMVAAKEMGRLRHMLRLLVAEERSPGPALDRLNRHLLGAGAPRIATVLLAVLDVRSGDLVVASAGHPFALAIGTGGSADLGVLPGPPLGAPSGGFVEQRVHVDECVLFFTDGLIERPGVHFDDALAMLMKVADAVPTVEPEAVVEHVLSGMLSESRVDDVALLAIARTA